VILDSLFIVHGEDPLCSYRVRKRDFSYGCSVTKTAVVRDGTTKVPVWVLKDDWPTIGSAECLCTGCRCNPNPANVEF
jgi:hypothetical protein